MTRTEARKTAKYLMKQGHKAIEIREDWPEGYCLVYSLDTTYTPRTYKTLADAKSDCEGITHRDL